jgi:hypothetical protein
MIVYVSEYFPFLSLSGNSKQWDCVMFSIKKMHIQIQLPRSPLRPQISRLDQTPCIWQLFTQSKAYHENNSKFIETSPPFTHIDHDVHPLFCLPNLRRRTRLVHRGLAHGFLPSSHRSTKRPIPALWSRQYTKHPILRQRALHVPNAVRA